MGTCRKGTQGKPRGSERVIAVGREAGETRPGALWLSLNQTSHHQQSRPALSHTQLSVWIHGRLFLKIYFFAYWCSLINLLGSYKKFVWGTILMFFKLCFENAVPVYNVFWLSLFSITLFYSYPSLSEPPFLPKCLLFLWCVCMSSVWV